MGGSNTSSVLVVGGSSGIGLAATEHYVEGGASVVFTFHSSAEHGIRAARGVQLDVGSQASIDALLKQLTTKLDVLVNIAGPYQDLKLDALSFETIQKMMNENFVGLCYLITRLKSTGMLNRGASVVTLIGSSGVYGYAPNPVFAACKAAMSFFTRSCAREFAADGIRINCLALGAVESPMWDRLSAERRVATMNKMPLQRFGTNSDVISAIDLLVHNPFAVGSTVVLDGGATTPG